MSGGRVAVECSGCGGGAPYHEWHACPGARWVPIVNRADVRLILGDVGTLGDIAADLGIAPNRLANWAARYEDFPGPVGKIGRWNVYLLSEVRAWAESSDRIA